jgi:hypothetical protein
LTGGYNEREGIAPCSSENRNLTVATTITLAKARKIGLMDERT